MGLFRGLSPHLSTPKDGSYGPSYALNAGFFDFTGVVALIETVMVSPGVLMMHLKDAGPCVPIFVT